MNPRIQRASITLPSQQRGAVTVLMFFALVAILMMAALALDGGHMLLNKTRLQNAVDAAALSGAKTLSQMSGSDDATDVARIAALATLEHNANASGNSELAEAIGPAEDVGKFAIVDFSDRVDGVFSLEGPEDEVPRFVRVSVPNYPLAGFFWGMLQTKGDVKSPAKAVAAIATAGPSSTSPCDLAPLMVCGDTGAGQHDPENGLFWGFRFGEMEVLKSTKNNTSGIGPGNFQLLDFGSGGKTVRDELAGGGTLCPTLGNTVKTKPGNTVGPSVSGLNTRFGDYQGGGVTPEKYPPDLVTDYNKLANGKPALEPDLDNDTVSYLGPGGGLVSSDANGNITTASGKELFDYNNWMQRSATCVAGGSDGCQAKGVFERRMLKIVIGQCSGTDGGTAQVPVRGFGCFFVLQPMEQSGGRSWLLGQFVRACEGDNVPGPNPTPGGPQIIQLYKTLSSNDS